MPNKWSKRYLTRQELEGIVANLSDSEDSMDIEENDENVDVNLNVEYSILTMPIEFKERLMWSQQVQHRSCQTSKEI